MNTHPRGRFESTRPNPAFPLLTGEAQIVDDAPGHCGHCGVEFGEGEQGYMYLPAITVVDGSVPFIIHLPIVCNGLS